MNASSATRSTSAASSLVRASAGRVARIAELQVWRADLAALLYGVAAALALPPYNLLPVLLLEIPGLLALIDRAARPAIAARRGW